MCNNRNKRSYGKSARFMEKQFSAYKDSVGNTCEICGSKENIQLHHKDGDYQNNNVDNFMALCSECHHKQHGGDKKFTGFVYDYEFDKIVSITEIGVEDCYDITMEGTENEASFIGNGFILHNCPHAIKHYENDAWDKFYVFDVMRGDTYLRFEDYKNILDNFQIDYVPVMAVLNSPSEEKICELAEKATYLCKPDTIGEGVVVHNYDFYNKYGRQTWAKVVNQKFKETKKEAYGVVECVEEIIVKEFLTPEEIEKEKCKIEDFNDKKIGELMGRVYHEFIRDNMNDIIKKHKNLTIRFKVLNGCICKAVREHLKL